MSTIGEVYDPNKQKTWWYHSGKDPGVKLADKAEDKTTGDAYDYQNTTKSGVDTARLERNVVEFAKTVTFSVLPKGLSTQSVKDGIFLAKCYVKAEELAKAVSAGKMTKAEAAATMVVFMAKENVSGAAKLVSASLALTMLEAVLKAVPFTLQDQKLDEQLYHDEATRLHVAESLKDQLPDSTYSNVDKSMSLFGQTHRKTETFAIVQKAYDKALADNPTAIADMRARCWHGKAAALELGIKDDATLAKALDPNNKDPNAAAFREMWNAKSNVAFRLGVQAMIDESKGITPKAKEMYAADVARFNKEKADQAALDAKKPAVKL